MSDKLCIDLCSGLGGLSQAFKDAGWEVITIDNDPKFNPTICADITQINDGTIILATKLRHFKAYKKIVVVASPPCQRFSLAVRTWPKPGIQKAMEIVGACLELIAKIHPDAWLLENPKARLRWFLGRPTGTIRLSDYGARWMKPTDLWYDGMKWQMLDSQKPYEQSWAGIRRVSTLSAAVRDPAKRALMPRGLSQAILSAVEITP